MEFLIFWSSFRDARRSAKPAGAQARNPDVFNYFWIPGSLAAVAAPAPE
jgi:hypothetical protein